MNRITGILLLHPENPKILKILIQTSISLAPALCFHQPAIAIDRDAVVGVPRTTHRRL